MHFDWTAAVRGAVGGDIGRQHVGIEVGSRCIDHPGCNEAKDRWEDAREAGTKAGPLENCDVASAAVATSCRSVGRSAMNTLRHLRRPGLPAENGA